MRHDARARGQARADDGLAPMPTVKVRVDAVAAGRSLRFQPRYGSLRSFDRRRVCRGCQVAKVRSCSGADADRSARPLRSGAAAARHRRFLLRAIHRSRAAEFGVPGPIVAESWGPWPVVPARVPGAAADLELLSQAAAITSGSRYESAAAALDPGEEKTLPAGAVALAVRGSDRALLLDVLMRRVRMFGYEPLSL